MKGNWRGSFLSPFKLHLPETEGKGEETRRDEPHLTVTALREGANMRGARGHSQLPSNKVAVFEFQRIVVQLAGEWKDTETFLT